MATAESVLKPDFGSKRKHFIFTEEHDRLRESIGSFVEKELAPHAERWEEETFDDWVFEPSMTRSSPSRTARVLMPATSEPASGSVIPRQEIFSPLIEGTR